VHNESKGLDFLVVCDDYQVLKAASEWINKAGGRINCAPDVATAKTYICRRKMDGVVLDMRMAGAQELIAMIRSGSSNKFSVVFACVDTQEVATIIRAGANFILHSPWTEDKFVQAFNAAAPLMIAEKRRYFRHPLMVAVSLNVGGKQSTATMTNLSENGMAIWCLNQYSEGTSLRFSFELPFGGTIDGTGFVAWASQDGLMGIRFHGLHQSASVHLSRWLTRRDLQTDPEQP
jgi:DNA-binding NarL/FixJ family response regulator